MRLTHFEVLENYFVWLADEGCSLKDFGPHFLWLRHVLPVGLAGLFEVPLLLLGQRTRVDYFVALLVVFGECSRLGVVLVHLNAYK